MKSYLFNTGLKILVWFRDPEKGNRNGLDYRYYNGITRESHIPTLSISCLGWDAFLILHFFKCKSKFCAKIDYCYKNTAAGFCNICNNIGHYFAVWW